MGTTLTAMTSGVNSSFDFVIEIEGFEYLLTTGSTSAAVTAWSGTDWSQAIGNLMIMGGIEQRLEPWKGTPDVSRLSFAVMPSADTAAGDIFGRLVFGNGNGAETYLSTALDCNDTTVAVLSTSQFASSGTIHIGTEAITYSGVTSTTFTGCTRGKYAPLTDASTGIGHEHRLPVVGEGVTIAPRVTSKQRTWPGRWVTVWAHRVVGGVLDTKAQAQRIWAGRITDTRDEANGLTYIDCESVTGKLRDTVLLRDQWTARVAEGIYLKQGFKFDCNDQKGGADLAANALVVVSSGAAGANEINEGLYTLTELISTLNTWLGAELVAGRLNFKWTLSLVQSDAGALTKWTWSTGSATETNQVWFYTNRVIHDFLGWGPVAGSVDTFVLMTSFGWSGAVSGELESNEEPYRILMYTGAGNAVTVENVRGTWFDNSTGDSLPPELDVAPGNSVAVIQVGGGPMAVFKYTNATTITGVTHDRHYLEAISGSPWDENGNGWLRRKRYSDQADLSLKQVVILWSRFKWLMLETLTSTGTTNHNYTDSHSHGDILPSQLGAAIPWEYLGTNFYNSLLAVDEMFLLQRLVIDKPTKWTEVFGGQFVARQVYLVWKNGGLVFKTWGTATAAHAEHAFLDATKHAPTGTSDVLRTVADQSTEWLYNSAKLEYDRILSGGYRSSISIVDPDSQDSYGERAVTIPLPGTFRSSEADLLADAVAMTMSTFSRPLHILKRPISPAYFENCVPGDFCTITDAFARNPATGVRGLTSKPGLIVRHRYDWGGYEIDTGEVRPPSGEVDILILPLSNISNYSPAAEVDAGAANAGYNAGTKVLTCVAHSFSESSEAADATRFPASSGVYVVQTNPSDPASFLSWSDTVASQTGNTITLTTGLAGWDNTLTYRVVSNTYPNATATQQADVYQADDADGMISDTVTSYAYGIDSGQATSWTDDDPSAAASRPKLYYNTMYGDGRPLDTGQEQDLARLINSCIYRRCSSLMSSLKNGTAKTYSGTGRKIIEIQPVHFGPGEILGDRLVTIGLWCRSNDGTSTSATISLCRHPPIGTSMTSDDLTAMNYVMVGPYETQTTSTTSSTSYALKSLDFSMRSVDPYTGIAYVVVEAANKLDSRGLAIIDPQDYVEAA